MSRLGGGVRICAALAAVTAAAGAVRAAPFEEQVLRLPFAVAQDPVPVRLSSKAQRDIAVFGEDERGHLRMAIFSPLAAGGWPSEPTRVVALPDDVVAYDVGEAPGGVEAFYFLTPRTVVRWEPEKGAVRVAEATSIHRARPPGSLPEVDFLRDVDGDGDLDLFLPDFDGDRVARAAGGAFESPALLPIPADVQRSQDRWSSSARLSYSPLKVELRDVTFDGQIDAVVLQKGELRIYPGRAGRFADTPVRVTLPMELGEPPGRDEMSEVDQRNHTWTYLLRIDDFDGDGVVDLFTQTVRSAGVFDKRHTLALHRGRREGASIAFSAEPSTRIESTVVVGEPVIEDIDRDGKLDVALGSVDFGLGALVSALLTGTIDVDLSVHRMGPDARFEEPPSVREEVTIGVDLTSGRTKIPLAQLADVDGDGRKDLLIGEGTTAIRVYRGTEGERSFAAAPSRYETALPGNGGLAKIADLDGDGREDVLLRYGKLDEPGLDRTVRVLVSR